ncbi:MAG: histidine phosphatase family protein [Bacteroidota bacterium]
MVDFFFIRHAESTGNVNNHLIGGRSDHFLLTERGEIQAKKLGERLAVEGVQFDKIFSSVAIRAKETARIACLASLQDFSQVVLDERLVESSQGIWEGQVRARILNTQVREQIKADPHNFQPPGGESQGQVEQRMFNWLLEHLDQQEGKQVKIAVFSHGMAIKCLLRKITQASYHLPRNMIIHNTSITRIFFNSSEWLVERINDHSHLNEVGFIQHYG